VTGWSNRKLPRRRSDHPQTAPTWCYPTASCAGYSASKPDLACTEYKNLTNGQQLLRSVKPEARVVLNGVAYQVGGLYGQKEQAYLLPQWIDQLKVSDSAFHYTDHKISKITPYLTWKTSMWAGSKKDATGSAVTFRFMSKLPALAGVEVRVHYAIFDGIPLVSKWVTVENKSKAM
jgi:hypothetical protein